MSHGSRQELPSVEFGQSELSDEISDVIEEHGRGLEADEISSTIDSVLAEYGDPESSDVISNAALKRELSRLIEDHASELERVEIVEVLREMAADLRSGSIGPDVAVDRRGEVHLVTLAFDCAFALQQALPKLFDIRGYFVEADLALTYLDEIRLGIRATTIDKTVELDGCVTRTAPNGFTVQVWQPSVAVERTLRALPDEMRAARV